MTDDTNGEYEVGFKKPPRHTRWVPGQSGNQGRRKKKPASQAEILTRATHEVVEIGGKSMTKFELAVQTAVNSTIKGGKVRDLAVLVELLDRHGALPKADLYAQMQVDADQAMAKISRVLQNTFDITPEDVEANRLEEAEEAKLVMNCAHCAPELRRRWNDPEYRARAKRSVDSALQSMIKRAARGKDILAI